MDDAMRKLSDESHRDDIASRIVNFAYCVIVTKTDHPKRHSLIDTT